MRSPLISIAMTGFLLSACASVKLNIINETGGPISNVEVILKPKGWVVPMLPLAGVDQRSLSIAENTGIAINYTNAQGSQYYTSAALNLLQGDSGEVTLGLTPQGTVRVNDLRKKRAQ